MTKLSAALASVVLLLAVAATPLRAGEQEQYQQPLRQLFHELDRNRDGRLDRREASRNAYLERHFSRLDQGDKGYLLPSDLR